jgi:hypothetical protein
VDGTDQVLISTFSSYVNISDCEQAEISGNTLTLKNVNLAFLASSNVFDCVLLKLKNQIIPAQGCYNFSATADPDGAKTEKAPSSGTGPETRVFYAAPSPITNLEGKAGDGQATFTFSKAAGATSVVLEQSTDDITFTAVSDIHLNADSDTATVTGLTNGQIYYFRLNVADGIHFGISYTEIVVPSRISTTQSSITIDTPLSPNSTSNITVTLRDDSGSVIHTQDLIEVVASTNIMTSYTIDGKLFSGTLGLLRTFTPDINGQKTFSIGLPSDFLGNFSLKITDANGIPIGSEFKYTYSP